MENPKNQNNESERIRIRCLRFLTGTLVAIGLTFGYAFFFGNSYAFNFIRPYVEGAAITALVLLAVLLKRAG